MILRPFQSNQTFVYGLLIPTIISFYVLNSYFQHFSFNPIVDLGLWGRFHLNSQWISSTIAGVLIAVNAFQLNFLFNKHEFLDRNIYAPALFYVMLMSLSRTYFQLDALLLVHVCWLQIIRILFQMRTGEDNRRQAFNSAIFVGVSATLIPAAGALTFVLWLATWTLKSFNFREWILMLIGFAIPLINAVVFWWYSGHLFGRSILKPSKSTEYEGALFYITVGAVFALFLLSLIGIQIRLRKSSIRYKKLNRALVLILVFCLLFGIVEVIFYQQVEWFTLLFIPLSFFFTFAFIHDFWKKIATTIYYLIAVITIGKFFLSYAVAI